MVVHVFQPKHLQNGKNYSNILLSKKKTFPGRGRVFRLVLTNIIICTTAILHRLSLIYNRYSSAIKMHKSILSFQSGCTRYSTLVICKAVQHQNPISFSINTPSPNNFGPLVRNKQKSMHKGLNYQRSGQDPLH